MDGRWSRASGRGRTAHQPSPIPHEPSPIHHVPSPIASGHPAPPIGASTVSEAPLPPPAPPPVPAPIHDAETIADLLARLGDVPPSRVRLRPWPGTATEADVVAIEAKENRLFELI